MRAVALLLLAAPAIARAQSFPDLPYGFRDPFLSPYQRELLTVLDYAQLVEGAKYDYQRFGFYSGPGYSWSLANDLDGQLRLLSVWLNQAVGATDERREWVEAWQRQLPVAEELMRDLLGGWDQKDLGRFRDTKAVIDHIKKVYALRGTPIDEHRMSRFSDVPRGHWADEAIHALRRAGIVTGYPDNTFRK